MNETTSPSPEAIRAFRRANPGRRERDIAAELGISEAALVAAECGHGAIRIRPDANHLLERAGTFGPVMALSRNDSAVHEKIGVYTDVTLGKHVSMTLGKDIDLRVFPAVWRHGFAVTKVDGDTVRRSLQYFDAMGNAIHKVHLRDESDLAAYVAFVAESRLEDQSPEFVAEPLATSQKAEHQPIDVAELRRAWAALTDTHEFFAMLRTLKAERLPAIRAVGADFAWQLEEGVVAEMFARAAETGLPIMVFIANGGIVQIHSGPIHTIKPMGPWLNIMDETFHMHLRADHIAETWAVRKPTVDGHVTSVEAYGADGELIIQFFGTRKEGQRELGDWRQLVEALPAADRSRAV